MLNIIKYRKEYLILAEPEGSIRIIWMRAGVDDAIHVEIEIVKGGDPSLADDLRADWVAFAHPAVEFWDAHGVI